MRSARISTPLPARRPQALQPVLGRDRSQHLFNRPGKVGRPLGRSTTRAIDLAAASAASARTSATVSTATTTTRETSTENNTGKATVAYTSVANLRTMLSTVDSEWSTFGDSSYVSALVHQPVASQSTNTSVAIALVPAAATDRNPHPSRPTPPPV